MKALLVIAAIVAIAAASGLVLATASPPGECPSCQDFVKLPAGMPWREGGGN